MTILFRKRTDNIFRSNREYPRPLAEGPRLLLPYLFILTCAFKVLAQFVYYRSQDRERDLR